MSGSEPPSRIPKEERFDTQSVRDELSSKGKVEKVREVDADEARKQKFQKFYDGGQKESGQEGGSDKKPSVFDLAKEQADPSRAMVPAPAYSPPPDVSASVKEAEKTDSLPQGDKFWEGVDLPHGQGLPPKSFHEASSQKQGTSPAANKIGSPSLPALPAGVQQLAMNAAMEAAPYIQPETEALFYQMVGTMYTMAGPLGANLTEIVLNNPAFSQSIFFGSTITIAKYATAPDSFNVTLSGSSQAVASFQQNIPSLMAAFQNGNFPFKIGRLEVHYSTEKPIFQRKGKSREKGGGDLGERR